LKLGITVKEGWFMEYEHLVSVVIPTKNSEKSIARCLRSIRNQTYPNIETIIVDDYSRDNTVRIAEKLGARVVRARAIRSRARNIGAKEARGDFILSIDSDMELSRDVVEKCVEAALNGAEAVIIPEVSDGGGFWARCKRFERSLFLGEEMFEGPRFFRKSVFWRIGGYDPELEAGEDWDITHRARMHGVRTKRINSHIRHMEADFTLLKTLRREYRYAKTFYDYASKHPLLVKQQSIHFWKVLARKRRTLARNLIYTLGVAVMKLFEAAAHILGFLTGKPADYKVASKPGAIPKLAQTKRERGKR